jgi:hypothetical protein
MERFAMLGKIVEKINGLFSESLGALYDLIEKLLGGERHIWLAELKKFLRKEKCWIDIPKEIFTRLISGGENLVLGAFDGTRTIAKSGNIFNAGIDSDFENWGLNKKGKPTAEMSVEVHEIIKSGTFAQIFGAFFGASPDNMKFREFVEQYREDLRKLCMKSDDQIISFCEKFPEKLRKDGFGTFFLREDEDAGNFFVAFVDVYSGGLYVRVYEFETDHAWNADHRHRVVVPKLA